MEKEKESEKGKPIVIWGRKAKGPGGWDGQVAEVPNKLYFRWNYIPRRSLSGVFF